MKLDKAPTESYADIGGLEQQIQEIKVCDFVLSEEDHVLIVHPQESVELPLTHPELYEEMGIKPPKGVILYGVPGTGKTLLAKAVANQTSATFLRIVGSELIQKYLGDGPKLVRELFRMAEEHAPSIVFIDEIDAVGTKRYDSNSGGEREIQRTMLELLNQLDGFDSRGDVKVIMATNRIDSLDPALIRPGRIDRKIEFRKSQNDILLLSELTVELFHSPARYQDQTLHLQDSYIENEFGGRRRLGRVRHGQRRAVWCRHQGRVHGSRTARPQRTADARKQARLYGREGEGPLQEERVSIYLFR